jgi:hypothetical protein
MAPPDLERPFMSLNQGSGFPAPPEVKQEKPKHQFQAARAKIARAKKLLAELEAEFVAFLATKPAKCSTIFSKDEGSGRLNISFNMSFTGPPESISCILGDLIHNLRAALDLMACELARVAGNSDKGVYFPFCDKPEELDRMIKERKFHRAGEKAVTLLRTFQPYRGGNIELRALHDLDIHDKHRAVIPSAASFASPVVRMWDDDGTYNPTVVTDPNEVSMFQLVFPPESGFSGREMIPTCHCLVELSESVLEAFCALANG